MFINTALYPLNRNQLSLIVILVISAQQKDLSPIKNISRVILPTLGFASGWQNDPRDIFDWSRVLSRADITVSSRHKMTEKKNWR